MNGLRHLRKVLEQVPVLAAPHTLAEDIRVLDTAEECRRQQDVVDLLRPRSIAEGAWTAVASELRMLKDVAQAGVVRE